MEKGGREGHHEDMDRAGTGRERLRWQVIPYGWLIVNRARGWVVGSIVEWMNVCLAIVLEAY